MNKDQFQLTDYYLDYTVEQVLEEHAKATEKFPLWPVSLFEGYTVLAEEFGELGNALLEIKHKHKLQVNIQDAYKEAIQTAAMAIRMGQHLLSVQAWEMSNESEAQPNE